MYLINFNYLFIVPDCNNFDSKLSCRPEDGNN